MGVEVSPGGIIAQLSVKRELKSVHREGGMGNLQRTENSYDIHFAAEDRDVTAPKAGPRILVS